VVPPDDGPLPPPRRWAVVAAAIGAGIGTGLLGTSLHGHALYSGAVAVPLGAVAALVMLAAVELFVGLWSRNSWTVVLCGAAAYLCAGLLSMQRGAFGMISANIQGTVWLYGIALVTPLAAWLSWTILRRGRR
jgi:N-acetyl-1-D-myo-inositol-2-amino-2-deoxy-alpha-D-glucopyranoside deacetylase